MTREFDVLNLTPNSVKIFDDDDSLVAEWESEGDVRMHYEYGKVESDTRIVIAIARARIYRTGRWRNAEITIVPRLATMDPSLAQNLTDTRIVFPDDAVLDASRRVIGFRHLTELA